MIYPAAQDQNFWGLLGSSLSIILTFNPSASLISSTAKVFPKLLLLVEWIQEEVTRFCRFDAITTPQAGSSHSLLCPFFSLVCTGYHNHLLTNLPVSSLTSFIEVVDHSNNIYGMTDVLGKQVWTRSVWCLPYGAYILMRKTGIKPIPVSIASGRRHSQGLRVSNMDT